MSRNLCFAFILSCAALSATILSTPAAEKMPPEDAWKALPKYEHGQDMAALLAIDGEVIRAMAMPATRAACAARLAGALRDPAATLAAKQYVCLQLRQAGTVAEVPLLAEMLTKAETSQMARYVLELIPGPESLAALRGALGTLQGELLTGVINSVAARKDAQAVAKLSELASGSDPKVAAAAFWALGTIASPEANAFVADRVKGAEIPTPASVAVPALRCAEAFRAAGAADQARAIFDKLGQKGQPVGTRHAALEGLLRLPREASEATIIAWLESGDADERLVAAGHLASLSEKRFEALVARFTELPEADKLLVLQVFGPRIGKRVLPLLISAAGSNDPKLRLAAIRGLGMVGDNSAIPVLIDGLAVREASAAAQQAALSPQPRGGGPGAFGRP